MLIDLYSLNVARLANVPGRILQAAAVKSEELEDITAQRKLASL